VDDDPDMVEMLRLSLNAAGYIARVAATGLAAIRRARRSPPDLVLLDLLLPGMNGFSVCEALRAISSTASIPIIIVTALPGEFPRLAGIEAGADAYFSKPFQIQELLARVKEVLRQPRHLFTEQARSRASIAA